CLPLQEQARRMAGFFLVVAGFFLVVAGFFLVVAHVPDGGNRTGGHPWPPRFVSVPPFQSRRFSPAGRGCAAVLPARACGRGRRRSFPARGGCRPPRALRGGSARRWRGRSRCRLPSARPRTRRTRPH